MNTISKRVFTQILLIMSVLLVFVTGIKAEETSSIAITRDGAISPEEINVDIEKTPELQFGYQTNERSIPATIVWNLKTAAGADASNCALVDTTGKVTFIKACEEPLVLTCTANENESASVYITTVPEKVPELTGISPKYNPFYIDSSLDTVRLFDNLNLIPSDMALSERDFTYTSSNPDFFTSFESGELTLSGLASGETVITVEYLENPTITTSFTVSLIDSNPVTGISSNESLTLEAGGVANVNAKLLPENATNVLNLEITYSTDNPDILTVDSNGNVFANKEGTANVTASTTVTDENGIDTIYTATTAVQVVPSVPVQGITVDTPSVDLTTRPDGRAQQQLNVNFIPADTTQKNLNFSSLTPQVASVDENGLITAHADGKTTITVTDRAGHEEKISVTVSSSNIIADYMAVTANSPDNFTVTVKDLHPNRALDNNPLEVEYISCFTFSDPDMSDINAKRMDKNGTDYTMTFPINGRGKNNYFTDASQIKLHLYAKTNDGKENFLSLLEYNYSNYGTTPTNVVVTPYAQNIGFIVPSVGQDMIAGTIAQNRQLEGVRLSTPIQDLGLSYSVHAAGIGWMESVNQGQYAGTMGENRRIEAIRISPTGRGALIYDVQYRAYCEGLGWTNWVENGEMAGTVGEGRQIEALQVRIVRYVRPSS